MEGSSWYFLEWVLCGQDCWECLEEGILLDWQLLEAAWLLLVLCQQKKLPAFLLWGSIDAMVLPTGWAPALPHNCTQGWLWVCPAPCQGTTAYIPPLPVCPSSLFVANHMLRMQDVDAVRFSICFPTLP